MKSAIVLAGGYSTRIGEDKSVLKLAGKPLLQHIVDSVRDHVEEIVIVTNSQERVKAYSKLAGREARIVTDSIDQKSPLIGAMSGFGAAKGQLSLLLPSDTPFISGKIASFLFDACVGKAAAIPKWPNGQIEPLHAVYETATARDAAQAAFKEGKMDMRSMIEKMSQVRYVSTLVLEQFDAKLLTFFNINTHNDLMRAEAMMWQQNRIEH